MTMGIAGRAVRLQYGGAGTTAGTYVNIARATADSFEVANSRIDITSKDDAGVATALNDVGLREVKCTVSGILAAAIQHRTLTEAALESGAGNSLHWIKIIADGVGEVVGQFFIDSLTWGGDAPDGSATFEMSLSSSGVVAFTAAA